MQILRIKRIFDAFSMSMMDLVEQDWLPESWLTDSMNESAVKSAWICGRFWCWLLLAAFAHSVTICRHVLVVLFEGFGETMMALIVADKVEVVSFGGIHGR